MIGVIPLKKVLSIALIPLWKLALATKYMLKTVDKREVALQH